MRVVVLPATESAPRFTAAAGADGADGKSVGELDCDSRTGLYVGSPGGRSMPRTLSPGAAAVPGVPMKALLSIPFMITWSLTIALPDWLATCVGVVPSGVDSTTRSPPTRALPPMDTDPLVPTSPPVASTLLPPYAPLRESYPSVAALPDNAMMERPNIA